MAKKNQQTVSADLSLSPGLHDWLESFGAESRLTNSVIIRAALSYYRASTGPEVVLLQKRIRALEFSVTKPKVGWRGEVDRRLEALEKR